MLEQLSPTTDKNVLVDFTNADDAGVYRLSDDTAAVLTVDFFTPVVDDPYMFGAIAAANSLSDIYAMGGRPVVALNVAAFPKEAEFIPFLKEIMRGGVEKMAEAGVSIMGGHTLKDREPKFGFAVMGLIHPGRILDNSKARAGDALILTKPLGTGIVSTGLMSNVASQASMEEFTNSMARLNKRASEIMLDTGVSTATDITGFGLIGHLLEVLNASNLRARLHSAKVPYFKEVERLFGMGKIPGGTMENVRNFDPYVEWDKAVGTVERILMHDAQTSGGLLIFAPPGKKDRLVESLIKDNITAAHIGDVMENAPPGKRIIAEK